MNTAFKTKFLLHLNQKKAQTGEQGFTLIELLVVIIIIGILAAIALPSFLNQANKAKQSEGKQYVGSVNKGQQAYYTEFGTFVTTTDANAWNSLGVGIKTQTANYKYEIKNGDPNGVSVTATSVPAALKGYTGVTGLVGPAGADRTTTALVCEAKTAGTAPPPSANVPANATELTCAGDSKSI